MRTLTVALILVAGFAGAAPLPELEKAEAMLTSGKAPQALKMLDAIASTGRLDKENLVQLYQLRGMALAVLKKEPAAKVAFQSMLWVQPDAGLPPSADGKAFKAFRAAKDWARAAPALEYRPEPAATDDKGKVMQIAAFLKADPLKLVRKVRFHVRANGGSWGTMLESLSASYAATATEADGVEWWAELLTEKESVIATLASEESPVLEGKAKASKKAPPPKKEPKPVAKAEPAGEEKKPDAKKDDAAASDAPVAEKSDDKEPERAPVAEATAPAKPFVVTGVRGLGFGLAAVGAVSAIIGVVCGAASAGTRGELAGLPTDGSLVTTMTQKQAFEKEASANGLASAANVLLITGGVMAATGIVLVIAGGPGDDAKVTLAPMGAGAVLSGTLP
jgi:hypothetical protein